VPLWVSALQRVFLEEGILNGDMGEGWVRFSGLEAIQG
jgi:hypothetical protein